MSENQDQPDASTSTVTAIPDASASPSESPPTSFRASPSPDPSASKGAGAALAVPTIVDAPSDSSAVENDEDDGRQGIGEGSSKPAAANEDVEMGKEDEEPVVEAVMLQGAINEKDEEWWYLKMTWSGKVFDLKVGSNDMVYDFREQIHQLTSVPTVRQKVIGLSKGKLAAELDSTRFGTLGVKKDCKFTMIGTPESDTFKDPSEVKATVLDNFDVNYTGLKQVSGNVIAPADDPRNKRMIETLVKKIPITVMNEPRPGKKLLVLDLDYTMVDSKPLLAGSLPPEECARPGLHDFLERVYPHYDIVVWSQTGWRWLESKLVELGVIGGDKSYKISFVSDRTTMFPVFTQRNGQVFKHEVKPLAYFWASYPHWSAKNTVHIDDLARNFAMNPGEGLKIRAFNMAGQHSEYQTTTNYRPDRELYRLAAYLCRIAEQDDFTTIDHSKWKKTLGPGDQ